MEPTKIFHSNRTAVPRADEKPDGTYHARTGKGRTGMQPEEKRQECTKMNIHLI